MNYCKTSQKKRSAKGKTRKNAKKSATFVPLKEVEPFNGMQT